MKITAKGIVYVREGECGFCRKSVPVVKLSQELVAEYLANHNLPEENKLCPYSLDSHKAIAVS